MSNQKKKIEKYQPSIVEPKWQKRWGEVGINKTDLSKKGKYYVLAEFAYSSGDLHMGHWFTFTGADIYARFKKLQGYNIFFPNGFDAFGLPAENAAIKQGIHPQDWTMANIAQMKKQFASLGGSFSFDHEVITCLPEYYRWNQWIFLKMLEKGLVYRGRQAANWCPACQTVLANEGVEAGLCWRCGAEVVQKEVEQWFFKITDYAERLIWPLDSARGKPEKLNVDWPKSLREAQNNWIGKSEGTEIEFRIKPSSRAQAEGNSGSSLQIFTVFPETIFGVTYMVLAPESPLVKKLTTLENKKAVQAYIKSAQKKSELERTSLEKSKIGVFTGSYCINPVNGEKVPIWIADYVIATYGTGAVMGVPGSDHRDFAFAKKYNLPIVRVIGKNKEDNSLITGEQQVLEEGVLLNSGEFSGLQTPNPARKKIIDWLTEKGFGKKQTQYHLHDWSISRQRYWGTPIPIIHCEKCGIVPVPEEDLPVELPYDVDYTPKGKSPLASNEKWLKVQCPRCGGEAERDPDTMDTFVDSSWYFFRYVSPKYDKGPFDQNLAKKIMPVDIYFGGAEHNLGHTLYSRFISKVFHDLGLTDLEEYALKRVNHGIVLGPDGVKMSKSKGNVVNPDEEVKKYGADAVRIHTAFFMPYEGSVGPWVSERIWGPYRFLERVWNLFDKIDEVKPSQADLVMMNKTIKKVEEDIEGIRFNTAIAALMEWLNYLSRKERVSREEYKTFLLLLTPFAPHITEELWQKIANGEWQIADSKNPYAISNKPLANWSIHQQMWPSYNPEYLIGEEIIIAVQVEGKLRDTLHINPGQVAQGEVKQLALASDKVKKHLEGKTVKKVIYVEGKIINFVTL